MTGLLRRAAIAGACAFAAACSASPPPAPAPAPVATPPAAPAAAPPERRDSTVRDTTPPVAAVAGEAVRLFGDSIAVVARGDSEPASSASRALAPTWDINVRSFETRERVTYFLGRFQGEARPVMATWLQRGGRYEPMIRVKLRDAYLPQDLVYLALIESGYDPNAYSSAAAVGIWQLMAGTARGAGLRVDWWVDERRDPVRSTDGAVKVLNWLDSQFGSLFLAAAAYNGGEGRIARGLTRYADSLAGMSGDSAFFTLAGTDYLRAETRDYVPKLIAAALIAKDPARYGFTAPLDPPLAYDSVRVGAAVPLAAVARASGTELAAIMRLNNAILRGITPPRGTWWVRVPSGTAARADSTLQALPPRDRSAGKRVELAHGGSLAAVADRYGVSARALVWFNPELKHARPGTHVSSGTSLLIPSADALAGARDVPDPSIERYGHRRGHGTTHVVRQGETLGAIAAQYGTSAKALMRLNGLKKNLIFPGQVLVVKAPRRK